MSTRFRYRAATADGALVDGVAPAESQHALLEELRRRRLMPVRIDREREEVRRGGARRLPRRAAVALWARNFATLLAAAVPIDRALAITAEEAGHPELAAALHDVRRAVRTGTSLAEAMRRHPALFPPVVGAMVEAGEASGALDTVFERLAAHLEETAEMRAQVRAALIYPVLMATVASLGVAVLLLFVVPRFATILDDMGGGLPLTTRLLVSGGELLRSWWVWVVAGAGVAYAAFAVRSDPKLRRRWHELRAGVPWLGDLERKYVVARFARTLGILLQSGSPVVPALRVARASVGNPVTGEEIDAAIGRVVEGSGVAAALRDAVPSLAAHMLAVGEESGRLEELALRVADAYDRDVRRTLDGAIALIEPVMILIFGALVGFVALAMLQAIYSVNAGAL